MTSASLRKAVFLDRDGVINLDHGYVYRWEDFQFVPGAIDAMRRLRDDGYALVVVTNQAGVARGYYTEDDVLRLGERIRTHLAEEGIELAAIEYCPHLPEGPVAAYACVCDCRKPAPGMVLRAAARLGLDLPASLMFGDKPSDLQAARAAGVGRYALLATDGVGGPDALDGELAGAPRFRDLAEAIAAWLPPAAGTAG
jgi:D-glycero-D-manno-heptose 1,7-bisphosphate phosphatase